VNQPVLTVSKGGRQALPDILARPRKGAGPLQQGHTGERANVARIDGSVAPESELTWRDFQD